MARRQGDSFFDEAQHHRLRALADSVNETARMARTTLSILLLVALYLAMTLLSASDENLFRQGPVKIPQLGVGFPVVQSFIFAPVVFLFMHAHALFVLNTLARKVRIFEAAIIDYISDIINLDEKTSQKREYRDWLSSFVFVQIFQNDAGKSQVARLLTWLAISAIPLSLLFFIDISFVRYQSQEITWFHHGIFLLDSVIITVFYHRLFFKREWKMPKWFGTCFKGVVVLLLLNFAQVPSGDETPKSIWCFENTQFDENREGKQNYIEEKISCSHNSLDKVCKWWGIGCRYLDVSYFEPKEKLRLTERNLRFARFTSAQLDEVVFLKSDLRGANFEKADLQRAFILQSDLQKVYLVDADLQETNLQKANLRRADLQGADLTGSVLQGAILDNAKLRKVNLSKTDLRSRDFSEVNLQEAILQDVDLSNAIFKDTNLQEANLTGAKMNGIIVQSEDFPKANVKGAIFSKAKSTKVAKPQGKTSEKEQPVCSLPHFESVSQENRRHSRNTGRNCWGRPGGACPLCFRLPKPSKHSSTSCWRKVKSTRRS